MHSRDESDIRIEPGKARWPLFGYSRVCSLSVKLESQVSIKPTAVCSLSLDFMPKWSYSTALVQDPEAANVCTLQCTNASLHIQHQLENAVSFRQSVRLYAHMERGRNVSAALNVPRLDTFPTGFAIHLSSCLEWRQTIGPYSPVGISGWQRFSKV